MKRIILTCFLISAFAIANSEAQETTETPKDSTKGPGVQFKFSLNYNSGLNYYGRTDSLKSKGVFPLAEIWFTPKFYINAAPVFVYNKLQSLNYAGSVATLGYLNVTKKWISNLYVLKPFYKESSELVQSAMKVQAGASFTALNKVLNISFGGNASYSDKFDFGATAGLDHIFRKQYKDNSVFVVDPSFTINAGSQNFSKTYKRKTGGIFPREQQVTETYQQFNLLSFEASMPIIYSKNKWQLIAIPAYVLPKNLVKVENRPDLTETGENMFYSTVTVKYLF
jgi:hypothetical protein